MLKCGILKSFSYLYIMMKKQKNINSVIPDGKYFQQPSNRTHKDKSKYNRKTKHKNETDNF